MKVIKPKEDKKREYKVGDIFEIKGYDNLWILVQEEFNSGYILRGLGTAKWQGFNGSYNNIPALFDRLDKSDRILNHYSIDDYELHLVKKQR